MSIPGETKYRELLERLQIDQSWIKNYLYEQEIQKTIRSLEAQVKELMAGRGETKAVIITRLKARVEEIDKKLQTRSLFIAHRLIKGDSIAGRPVSEDFDTLIIERIKVQDFLIPSVQSLNLDDNDKRIKRVDTEINERNKSIGELRKKLGDKKFSYLRYPYKADGTLNVSFEADLYKLYLETLIEFSRGLPGEVSYAFSDLEKELLLKASGIKVNENKQ